MGLNYQTFGRLLAVAILFAVASPLRAENEGQEKLDEATGLKISAESPADWAKVIELCEEAIELGLDETSTKLAKRVLADSAFKRAQMLIQQLPRIANNQEAVRRLRRSTLRELQKAVDNNPELAEAFLLMARLEVLQGGNVENARNHLDTAIELLQDKPVDQANAYILRAGLREDNEDKLEDLAKAIQADSTNTQAWQARVALQMAMGKLQEAVDDAKKMLEDDDSNMFALQAAIQSLLELEKTDEAIELLSSRIEQDPENGIFYRVRARAKIIKGDQESALEDLNQAIEIDQRDFEALVLRGQIYYDMGEFSKANRDITDSLLIEPQSIQGITMRSLVAAREGRYGDAIADMEMLVRADPRNEAWIMQLASYYQMDDRPRKAVDLLDKLVDQDKNDWRALRLRGDAKLSTSEHLSAIEDYEEAIRILDETDEADVKDPADDVDYSGLLNNLAWVLATSPDDDLRNGERALELGLKACEASKYEAAHILSTLAAAYAETGDFENARKWSAKAVELGEKEEDYEQLDQLKLELESYQEDKPWREEQDVPENDKPLSSASETIDT